MRDTSAPTVPMESLPNEALVQRLPLPLAQLYRRAHNAKTPLERHNTAFYCWEASLKLIACGAIVEYAALPTHDPPLTERLTSLARPSLGHWWEFIRLLLPILADRGVADFARVRDLIVGKVRDDLPRNAGLDAALRDTLDGVKQMRSTVRMTELLDRLVRYRNQEIGHGASGRRGPDHYQPLAAALLAGFGELLERLDCLAGRRLIYVGEVRRQATGAWLVERSELIGETSRRIESIIVDDAQRLPLPERVYLEAPGAASALSNLHPLMIFDAADEEVYFLNSRRGHHRTEYLGYTSGAVVDRPDLGGEQRALLGSILRMEVNEHQAEEWARRWQTEEPAPQVVAPPSARQIGEFELLSELGRGGMGIVYRAWQPSLGRHVALKKLQRSGDAKAEARFAREIHALGRVEHPNLVKIFVSGAEGEHWFYAMELVEGATLAAVCERLHSRPGGASSVDIQTWCDAVSTVCEQARQAEKPLSDAPATPASPALAPGPITVSDGAAAVAGKSYVRHVVGLMAQVAEAAHALHEAGILHRDIKPGNILVGFEGRQAVLMDLGLAQLVDDVEGRLTRTRQFVGTLRYASPQQVLAVGQLDRRADVYSLGATLWEILALRPLFGATEQTPTPVLMEQIQREDPARLSRVNPSVSADLEAIVHKCLEKAPERRYATAHELARDLQRYLSGEVVRARPVRGWERAWKWVKRHPATAAVYGLLMLAVVLGLIGGSGWWLWQEALTAQDQAESALASERRAREQLQEAQRQTDEALGKERSAKQALDAAQFQLRRLSYLDRLQLANQNWQRGQVTAARELLAECDPAFRNWEWQHFNLVVNQELLTLRGHTNWVMDVAFSPDGQRLASASDDGTVKLWNAETGDLLFTLRGHKAGEDGALVVRRVVFNCDGKRLASFGLDDTVVWDTETGKQIFQWTSTNPTGFFRGGFSPDGSKLAFESAFGTVMVCDSTSGKEIISRRTGVIGDMAFSPDGKWLAVSENQGNFDGELLVLPMGKERSPEKSFLQKEGGRYGVAFSPDSQRLASAGHRNVTVWQLQSGQELLRIPGSAYRVRFSPDGTLLAANVVTAGGSPDHITVWQGADGKKLLAFPAGTTSELPHFAFSPDSMRLAVPSPGNSIKIMDTVTGKELQQFAGHTNEVLHVAFSPDGARLASGSKDGTVRIWPANAPRAELRLPGHGGQVLATAFCLDGQCLAVGGDDQTVKVWNATTGQKVASLTGIISPITSLVSDAKGGRLALACTDGTVQLWQPREGSKPLIVQKPFGRNYLGTASAAFSPDGQLLAACSVNSTATAWRVDTGKEAYTLRGHERPVQYLAFSPDGKFLATACADGSVKLWDAQGGAFLRDLRGHAKSVVLLTFSPSSRLLTSVDLDRCIKVWNVDTGAQHLDFPTTYEWRSGGGARAAFSPDGSRLVGVRFDNTAVVWDASSGKDLLALRGHANGVLDVAFSPDGQRLVTLSKDQTVKVWDAVSGRELLTLPGVKQGGQVMFSSDGKMLAAPGLDGEVHVWSSVLDDKALLLRQQVWAEHEIAVCEAARRWYAAAFFLDQSIARQPDRGDLRLRRGEALAEQSLWDRASADFAPATTLLPHQSWLRYALGVTYLAGGKTADYRRTCRQALQDFAASTDSAALNNVAWLGVLAPDSIDDPVRWIPLAEKAAKARGNLDTLGAAYYRAKKYKEAVEMLNKARGLRGGAWSVQTKLFLAMAHHQLGHAAEAKDFLTEASAPPGKGANAPRWNQRIEIDSLRREAEALLGGQGNSPKSP